VGWAGVVRDIIVVFLPVEYAEQRTKYGILFIFRPFYEYSDLEYVHVPV